jgi:acyl-CoA thioesterase-1
MLRINIVSFLSLILIIAACNNEQTTKNQQNIDSLSVGIKAVEQTSNQKNILFFGTSLTAGLGLDPQEAYPALIQQKIDSLNLPYKVINGGLSGETSAGGKSRIDWLLKQPITIFVLELGANDGLRGIPLTETRANLQAIIDMVRAKNPQTKIVLAGMQIPPNLGKDYTTDFKNIYPELATANDVALIPFLLEGVAGVPELNLEDGIHPTAEGQKIVAKTVWNVLQALVLEN